MHDPITVCYLASLVFLCGVLAVMVFGSRETVLQLLMRGTIRAFIIVMVLAVAAGTIAMLLWKHLGGAFP